MVSGNNSLPPAAKVWGLFDLIATVRSASPREPQPQKIPFFLYLVPTLPQPIGHPTLQSLWLPHPGTWSPFSLSVAGPMSTT